MGLTRRRLSFQQVCMGLYIKLHVFTAMRKELTNKHEIERNVMGSPVNAHLYVQSALLTLAA